MFSFSNDSRLLSYTWPPVQRDGLSVVSWALIIYPSDSELVVLSGFESRDAVISVWYVMCHWSPVMCRKFTQLQTVSAWQNKWILHISSWQW